MERTLLNDFPNKRTLLGDIEIRPKFSIKKFVEIEGFLRPFTRQISRCVLTVCGILKCVDI